VAKYSRYDSRNKKRNRHKEQYLERGKMGRRNRERLEADLYEKYTMNKTIEKYA
jgi:hypothetical protein